jgi:two-component system OmpR family sensor kinase
MKSVVANFSAQAEARAMDLGITRAMPVQIIGHPDSLRVMLNNLVDNALRYTPTGGRVDLALIQKGESAILTVSDNGPGIQAEERTRVLERFYRSAGGDIQGSGLGLAIVREVVTQHHADLSLEDAAGGGLTVRIVFPTPAETD